MKTFRRVLFWALLAAFIGVTVWWILHVPYRPDRVYTAIPADAMFVSVHDDPADRIDALLANPLALSLLASAGVRPEDVTKFSQDATTRKWIRRLASHKVVIAYVPALGRQQKPAWVLASWIGGHSQRLRWNANLIRSADLRPIRLDDGGTVWATRTRFAEPRLRLSLTAVEGLLLACVSTDPTAVRWLVKTSDGDPRWPSLASAGRLQRVGALWPAAMRDRGWVALRAKADPALFGPSLLTYGLDVAATNEITGQLTADDGWEALPALKTVPGLEKLCALVDDTPDLVCALPTACLAALDFQAGVPAWMTAAQTLLDTNQSSPSAVVFGCLLNKDHGGRIRGPLGEALTPFMRGLRVPTLLLATPVRDERDAAARVAAALDTLNRRYSLGLIPHPFQQGPYTVTVVEDTRKSFYGRFELDERVAVAVIDGWLILSSNAGALKKLIARQSAFNAPSVAPPAWRSNLVARPASGYVWANLKPLNKTLKEALAATTLALLVRDPQGTLQIRQNMAVAKAWLDGLRPFGNAQAWLSSTQDTAHLEFVVGADSGAAPGEP